MRMPRTTGGQWSHVEAQHQPIGMALVALSLLCDGRDYDSEPWLLSRYWPLCGDIETVCAARANGIIRLVLDVADLNARNRTL